MRPIETGLSNRTLDRVILVPKLLEYLEFAKQSVKLVAADFKQQDRNQYDQVTAVTLAGKETKIVADTELEGRLLKLISTTGISVFSEESGLIRQGSDATLLWVLDPLDGSVNYLRGVGPSAISLALCQNNHPIFGVIYSLDNGTMSWGGYGFGSWTGKTRLSVSANSTSSNSILCTGFPARFNFLNDKNLRGYTNLFRNFSKVRMLGSAASSLLMVAQGKADAYYESNIMFWDIAAGMALVEGAGGALDLAFRDLTSPCVLTATNSRLIIPGTK